MEIKSFQGGYDKNLSYILWCKESLRAAIVDPSVEPLRIFEFIDNNNLILDKILITHTHYDHITYLSDFLYYYPSIRICAFKNPVKNLGKNFHGLTNSQIINVGKSILIALYTPGHYPDCMCFWDKNKRILLTGDTIFVGRTGRTVSSGSKIEDLYNSVYNKILKLPLSTKIYPGHNYGFSKICTLKENMIYSPFFQCKSFHEFKIVMDNYERNRK